MSRLLNRSSISLAVGRAFASVGNAQDRLRTMAGYERYQRMAPLSQSALGLQLIQALQRAGKSFDLQVGPDQGHSALNGQRMMEFFIEHLVVHAGFSKAN